MDDKRIEQWLLHTMYSLNLLIVLFLSTTIALTGRRIAESGRARAFFDVLAAAPDTMPDMPLFAIGVFTAMYALSELMNEQKGLKRQLALMAAQVVLCVVLMRTLRMSYSGLVLLVAASFLLNFEAPRWIQMIFLGLFTVLYLCSDFDFISLQIPMASFQDYLFYYDRNASNLLLSMKNVLSSINLLVFVVIVVEMSLRRTQEHKKVIRLNHELEQANRRIMEYAIESERTAATAERNRLAREIHDTIGHTLTGISAGLDAARTLLDLSPEAAKKQIEMLGNVARDGLKDVRRSVHALGPDALDEMTLDEAIRKLVHDTAMATGASISLISVLDVTPLRRDEQDTVYRIVQEGMTNAIKHGRATEIAVKIKREGQWLVVIVSDNGAGCADYKQGFGLKHMEERVVLLGGRLRVKSFRGFTIVARLPLGRETEND